MPRYQRDPVKIELLKNALTAIADEMAITVVRTARSFVIKESLDFSTGLMDADGAPDCPGPVPAAAHGIVSADDEVDPARLRPGAPPR